MNIAATQYSLQHKAVEIYLAGCRGPHCENCHNPELHDFSVGTPWRVQLPSILDKIERAGDMVNAVWILGGEPMHQDPEALFYFVQTLSKFTSKPLFLFTKYEIDNLDPAFRRMFDVVKTGPYRPELASDNYTMQGIKLASLNQLVHRYGVHYF